MFHKTGFMVKIIIEKISCDTFCNRKLNFDQPLRPAKSDLTPEILEQEAQDDQQPPTYPSVMRMEQGLWVIC
jgi:hypothetical protein